MIVNFRFTALTFALVFTIISTHSSLAQIHSGYTNIEFINSHNEPIAGVIGVIYNEDLKEIVRDTTTLESPWLRFALTVGWYYFSVNGEFLNRGILIQPSRMIYHSFKLPLEELGERYRFSQTLFKPGCYECKSKEYIERCKIETYDFNLKEIPKWRCTKHGRIIEKPVQGVIRCVLTEDGTHPMNID